MEEAKPVKHETLPTQLNSATVPPKTLSPQDPLRHQPPSSLPIPSSNGKRKRGHDDFNLQLQNSPFFKIHAQVRELRPLFMEVLRTPDFRSCKAAHEIQERMKHVLVTFFQLTGKEPSDRLSERKRPGESMSRKEHLAGKQPDLFELPDLAGKKPSYPNSSGNMQNDFQSQMSYVVGRSAVGWNFITFTAGSKPVYYGVTKESYRGMQKKTGQ